MTAPTTVESEPIAAVLARLAPVDVDALSVAGCDRWLADAARVAGWLTVMRLDVEQARAHKAWAGSMSSDDDASHDPDDDASGAGGHDGEPSVTGR